jgi:hypothetical protein
VLFEDLDAQKHVLSVGVFPSVDAQAGATQCAVPEASSTRQIGAETPCIPHVSDDGELALELQWQGFSVGVDPSVLLQTSAMQREAPVTLSTWQMGCETPSRPHV